MKCWNCLSQLGETASFCPTCGMDVVNPKAESSRLVICPTCSETFPEAQLAPNGLSADCPSCIKRRQEEKERIEKRKEVEREKFEQSARSHLRNQRNADRFEVARCFVRVSRTGIAAMLLQRDQSRMGPLIDLSATGLQCEAEGEFDSGDSVGVKLLVPAFKEPLGLQGKVRWAEAVGTRRTRMGIQFDKTDPATRKHIQALEEHQALREAAILREEKSSSSAAMLKVPEEKIRERPADF